MPAKRQHRDRPESRVVWRLRRDLKYRAAPESQRCAQREYSQGASGVAATKWKRVFPVELSQGTSRRALHLRLSRLLPVRLWIEVSHAFPCQKRAGFVPKRIPPGDEFHRPLRARLVHELDAKRSAADKACRPGRANDRLRSRRG